MARVIFLFCFLFTVAPLQGQTVYKTPSGQKYHLGSCRMVKNVSEAIPIAKARELGLQPCLICKPPVLWGDLRPIRNRDNRKRYSAKA